jgi:hypothetical protein
MAAPLTPAGGEMAPLDLAEVPAGGQLGSVPHTFRAMRHRNFRLFIIGQIVSLVGTWMQNVAQSWLVYRLTHSELLLGTAVMGTLVLARRTRVSGLARLMVYSGMLTGGAYLAFAFSRHFYFSLAVMPVIGYSVRHQMASANTTIQTLIPDEYRGRTMALYAMTVVGLGPFGSLAAGAVAAKFGARAAVAAGGLLALAAAGTFAWSLRRRPI